AIFQDGAVLLVVLGVDVSFVPAFKTAVALHDGMIGSGDGRAKRAGAVAFELGADQLDVLRRVQETVRGTVQRNEALAAGYELEQGRFLLGTDPGGIGVDDQSVIGSERFGI